MRVGRQLSSGFLFFLPCTALQVHLPPSFSSDCISQKGKQPVKHWLSLDGLSLSPLVAAAHGSTGSGRASCGHSAAAAAEEAGGEVTSSPASTAVHAGGSSERVVPVQEDLEAYVVSVDSAISHACHLVTEAASRGATEMSEQVLFAPRSASVCLCVAECHANQIYSLLPIVFLPPLFLA